MLSELFIRNVVLIETLDLELPSGLVALTGETGAGKSIILDALGMATGARSDKGLVRKGADMAQCTARFLCTDAHPVFAVMRAADLAVDGEEIVLRRTVSSDGRSRAYINDAPVSARLLAQVGAQLLEVHGQHDGRGLMDPAQHITVLDNFGGYEPALHQCQETFATWKSAQKTLEELKARQAKSGEDQEFLRRAIAELTQLAPEPDEDSRLAAQRRLLQHSEHALSELNAAGEIFSDDSAIDQKIGQVLAGLERVRTRIGRDVTAALEKINIAAAALEKVLVEAEEGKAAIADAAQAFTFEPGELDTIEERLFALRAAGRKYGCTVAELPEKMAGFEVELAGIADAGAHLTAAQKAADAAYAAYDKAASKLTRQRENAAQKLSERVSAELPSLKMAAAKFSVQIGDAAQTAQGRDDVRFFVATNPGVPPGPIDKIASGGELSRLSLAIKVALQREETAGARTMIFDEIDAGIGGAVADAAGRRLSRLSEGGQVLVVTHAPQVAACADAQFLISKQSKNDETRTDVRRLGAEEREEEIARMLAGEEITNAARAAARQLLHA